MNGYDDEMVEAANLIIAATGITSEELLAQFQSVLTKDVVTDLLLITYYGGEMMKHLQRMANMPEQP